MFNMGNREAFIWLKDNKIYNRHGLIENMSVLLDKRGGLVSYGDLQYVQKEYNTMMTAFKSNKLSEMCESLMLVDFSAKSSFLTVKEVGTFVNYMLLVSANGNKIVKMLNLNKEDLKIELEKLIDYGFGIEEIVEN